MGLFDRDPGHPRRSNDGDGDWWDRLTAGSPLWSPEWSSEWSSEGSLARDEHLIDRAPIVDSPRDESAGAGPASAAEYVGAAGGEDADGGEDAGAAADDAGPAGAGPGGGSDG